ncbi:WecB/TagA/CpsF family glycosyltransferase [Sphingobacterium alkalisoli]|uniref:WecB/TagA/CpsF family glycosyltransferase n=1 Tax=Sphingobacterium alkalisoli TaxID=1874115 RepID=A0A4U0GRI6_9SPHI|nr:WecB/TagA/CpsF family glycosyltransferase [Sphingobacterium alkalisoli]TJY61366.1 WecB/TagA/CpsF family glycosyltransferase [Sphingobacterium alkalisoli]GGH30714.1 UDP-hexose transferase [Sphingobacterium alkalisoli]
MGIKTINFCDIELVCVSRDEFAKFAIEKSREFQCAISYSLNGESLAKYHYDKSFAPLLLEADYIHADGMSIVAASKRICEVGLPERIATTDWFHDVARLSEQTGEGHYFLGGSEDTIQKTIANVRKQYPKLNIVGFKNGYFTDNELSIVLDDIRYKKPHIIWVGLGRPKQEEVSVLIRDTCEVGLIKTCGGLFDFLSGNNKRSPMVLQKLGLEWLYRLSLEPKRLFKRYLVTNSQCLSIFFKFYLKK